MPNLKMKPQQGPDPAVQDAIQRLVQTQLSPLEEVIFQSWMQANQLEENPQTPYDYRGLYQQTGGKVYAPGELGGQVTHQNAIQTLMQAQEAHDKASPVQMLMEAGGDPSALQGGSQPNVGGGEPIGSVSDLPDQTMSGMESAGYGQEPPVQ